MNRYILFIALMIGVLLSMCQKAVFGDVSDSEQDAAVTMTITKLQVDDQTLVIRRRFDLPAARHLELPLPIGQYVCLRAGEERVQSLFKVDAIDGSCGEK